MYLMSQTQNFEQTFYIVKVKERTTLYLGISLDKLRFVPRLKWFTRPHSIIFNV